MFQRGEHGATVWNRGLHPLLRLDDAGRGNELLRARDLLRGVDGTDPSPKDSKLGTHIVSARYARTGFASWSRGRPYLFGGAAAATDGLAILILERLDRLVLD